MEKLTLSLAINVVTLVVCCATLVTLFKIARRK